MIQIPEFKDHDELFSYLRKNKNILKIAKKAQKKEWAGIYDIGDFDNTIITTSSPCYEIRHKSIEKSNTSELLKLDSVPAKLIINTTNIRDSHKDVHIPGIWNKSLKEIRLSYLLKEHRLSFEDIINDDPRPSTEMIDWKSLGFNYKGLTQALVFNPELLKERNPYMFNQYVKGYVKNHSVGMLYVNLILAMNSDNKYDKEERDNYEKYKDQVVNLSDFIETDPYFWAVLEAKFVEGSAVPMGSNFVTPTISVGEQPKSLNSADTITEPEPMQWGKLAEAFKQSKS